MPRKKITKKKLNRVVTVADWIREYHSHSVVGAEHIPVKGPCLLIVNHSYATYDILLLHQAIYKETGRVARSLMDRWFFKVNAVGDYFKSLGALEGTQENARKILAGGELLCIAPGGMREAMRPSSERYQINWNNRKGFVRLALETGSPIILAACPKADDIFEIYENPLSSWFYDNFKIPFVILRGIGLSPIPKPVRLTHYLSEPIYPPPLADTEAAREKQLTQFHRQLIKRMNALIGQAVTGDTSPP